MKVLSMSLILKVIILQIQYWAGVGGKSEIFQETLSPIMLHLENATIGPMLIIGFHSKRASLNLFSYLIILEGRIREWWAKYNQKREAYDSQVLRLREMNPSKIPKIWGQDD